jgi:hypothetical protein
MGQSSVWFPLWILSALTNASAVNKTTFGFYPDRDNVELFSLRIPINVVAPTEPDVSERVPRKAVSTKEPDSINVKIVNDQGYICAEERESRNLEISGLPCDQCMQGKLLVTLETKKGNEILSTTHTILSDESKRAEICSLQPESKKEGEDLIVTSPKEQPEDGCRWVFRDAGGSVGCCYSNRDYYTQTGGCDPRMQSLACRKGSEIPILVEEENSCTLHISNLRPADSGNYLSRFKYSTPGFKKILFVEDEGELCKLCISFFVFLSSICLLGVLTVIIYLVRSKISKMVKENLRKMSCSEI